MTQRTKPPEEWQLPRRVSSLSSFESPGICLRIGDLSRGVHGHKRALKKSVCFRCYLDSLEAFISEKGIPCTLAELPRIRDTLCPRRARAGHIRMNHTRGICSCYESVSFCYTTRTRERTARLTVEETTESERTGQGCVCLCRTSSSTSL